MSKQGEPLTHCERLGEGRRIGQESQTAAQFYESKSQ